MADKKISELTADASPTGTDYVPVLDTETSTTKKVLLSKFHLVGGTDVPLTDGGTGASSAEAAYSNIADMKVEPTTDDTATGPRTNDINAGATIAQWEILFLANTGKWSRADADSIATCAGMLAIALEAGTDTNPIIVGLPGCICRNDAWAWTVGATLYLSTTIGEMTETPPSGTDDVVRVVGYALTDDCIYFFPSQDHITIV